METLTIKQLRLQFKGRPFCSLVDYYLKEESSTKELKKAVLKKIASLPPSARSISIDFIERWIEYSYSREFWQKPTSKVLSEIMEDARSALAWVDAPTDNKTLFNMFHVVVLSYAHSASDQPNMREFIGIQDEQ